ncbi:helix-turn-helix domain-containing protein [Henriciella aquimarina]|uniref:helix-turn-helix domain-containing protein n=1 Tax=Henriciella aquimarina TaxID=545261 RepID=UPI001301FA50|nr:helix-turn-helix domain-containing protein [Henriciella aquimarina]
MDPEDTRDEYWSQDEMMGKPSHYHPHQPLYLEGDPARAVFRIVSGVVIVYRLLPDGRRQIHSFVGKGDFLALDLADTYRHSAEAITEVSAELYMRQSFDRAMHDKAGFRRQVFKLLTDMLMAAQEQAVMLGRKTALERTASFLLFLDHQASCPDNGYVVIRMSRYDIADYLGLTFETVSRMLHRLKNLGLISLPKPDRFRVLKRSALAQVAGEPPEPDQPRLH